MSAEVPAAVLVELALSLLADATARLGRRTAARAGPWVLGGALAALCFIAALGCATAALWIYARPIAGDAGAPLVVSGVLLVVSALCVVVMQYRTRRLPPPVSASRVAQLWLADVGAEVRDNKEAVLLAALLAGLAAGSKRD